VQYKWHLEMPPAQSQGKEEEQFSEMKMKRWLFALYLHSGCNSKCSRNLKEHLTDIYFCKTPVYLKARRDQTTPTMLEYVLGLRMSLRNVMTEMSLTITIVGGMSFLSSSSSSSGSLGLSSVVEVEPNLSNRGPLLSISSTLKLCLFPKLKSSRE
jgi:hypothetical protein